MSDNAVCPVCDNPQDQGLACHACTTRLERDLGDVASIVADLDIAMSKQARIGNASGPSGLARERTPINVGAMQVADNLGNVLTTWARDITGDHWIISLRKAPALAASRILLSQIDAIRRHPAVVELTDEIHDAIGQARRVVDRPADRQYLGQCGGEYEGVTCLEEVWASPGASFAKCKVCSVTHDVADRQEWLMNQADDRLFTIREAARLMGSFGNTVISESTIRSYVSTGQLLFHGQVDGVSVIRLGDLRKTIAKNAAKRKGRRLRNAS